MPRFLVLLIYNLLLPIVLLIGFPSFIIKGIKRGGLARNFRQRLGIYQSDVKEKLSRPGNFWIHAVSVGEILVAEKIIRAILEIEPTRTIILSTTTTTGFAVADEKFSAFGENVTVIHNPVDLPLVTWRAIRLIQPEKVILVEAEVWPNLVRQLEKRNVPTCLVNARLSPRSEKRYQQFSALVKPIFQMLTHVCVQFQADTDRWIGLGVDPEKITLTGSVKFDEKNQAAERPEEKITELKTWLRENGIPENQPILLAGSTHAGEELLLGKIWRDFPDTTLVIVPRHAERAREIESELAGAGFKTIFRSNRVASRTDPVRSRTNPVASSASTKAEVTSTSVEAVNSTVLISDTTGELRAWFFLADVVFIGKSMTGKGGQNPAESILAGKPTIVGPNMQNFADIMVDLVAADGVVQLSAAEPELLKTAIGEAFSDPSSANDMALRGQSAMHSHQGAAKRTAEVVFNV